MAVRLKHNQPKKSKGILHLENLDTEDFFYAIKNLGRFTITEKLDGYQIIIGKDQKGDIYLSREQKGNKRYYNESEWDRKTFWTTPFRSIHQIVQNQQEIFSKHLGSNSEIELEIIFGEQPNTVYYGSDQKYAVLLRKICGKCNSNILLRDLQQKKFKYPSYLKIPVTDDGKSIRFRPEKHVWSFARVPQIDNKIFEKISTNFLVKKKLKNLQNFLEDIHPHLKVSNNQVSKINLVKDCKKYDASKNKIKIYREQVNKKIDNLKIEIKEIILDKSIRKMHSAFGELSEKSWLEGIVFKDQQGNQFKLVDKNVFTEMNNFNHLVRNEIKQDIWLDLKEQILQEFKIRGRTKKKIQEEINSNLTKFDFNSCKNNILELINIKINDLDKKLKEYEKNKHKYQKVINLENKQIISDYDGEIHTRTLQEFAGLFWRLAALKHAAANSKTSESLAEICLLGQKTNSNKLIKQGGNVFPQSVRILRDQIKPTLKNLSAVLKIPVQELEQNLLGSTGQTESSGDIDIAIDSSKYDFDSISKRCIDKVGQKHVKFLKGFDSIHLLFPIAGTKQEQVQIDLFVSENTNWTKFFFHSPGDRSKYKGVQRTLLISSVISATNQTKVDEGELVSREGWVMVPKKGVQYQRRFRVKNKQGIYNKTFRIKRSEKFISDPHKVITKFFGKDVKQENLDSFESTLNIIKSSKNEQEQQLIFEIFKKRLGDSGNIIPEEVL